MRIRLTERFRRQFAKLDKTAQNRIRDCPRAVEKLKAPPSAARR